MKKYFFLLIAVATLPYVSSCQITKGLGKRIPTSIPGTSSSTNNTGLSNSDIVAGLKEALQVGTNNGTQKVSQVDGYFANPLIKILMPPDVKMVEDKLRDVGLGSYVDQAVLSMNRAAEQAGKEAAPIFIDAIKGMTITDAVGILKGPDDAATQYLKANTSAQLTTKFTPVIKKALDQTQATKYWKQVFDTYNQLPFVQHVNSDLTGYVTQKALDGLFVTVAQEELKIRKDPVAQVTDILKRVFGHK